MKNPTREEIRLLPTETLEEIVRKGPRPQYWWAEQELRRRQCAGREDYKRRRKHRSVIEKALGRSLRGSEQGHHVDFNRQNNEPTNLVVCPSTKYHALIELRTRALNATGHTDWLDCRFCGKYDDPKNMFVREGNAASGHRLLRWHRDCANEARKQDRHRRREKLGIAPRVSATGYRGVSKKRSGKYRASMELNGKHVHLGTFNTPEEASLAYQAAVRNYRPRRP
jgi:hypothetical protein